MKKSILLFVVLLTTTITLFSQTYLESTTFIRSYTKDKLDSLLDYNGLPSAILTNKYTVDIYKMNYKCKDAFDTLVSASGLLIIPQDTCELPIFDYSHGTISRKTDAPSRIQGAEPYIAMVMASNGYLSIMPDYLGLGDGLGLHPYQHAKTEAYANIYMIKALKEYCATNSILLNNQLFISGYSQGGHAAMSTHRMIEKDFATEFTVTASAPMSGAYDMDNTMVDVMLSNAPYAAPAYLPYLVISWNPIYHLYPSISDAFKSPYDTTLPPLFNGTKTLGYIEARMPSVPKLIFDSTELDNFTTNLSHPFRLALKDNNSYTNWTPIAPLRMYYCTADQQVSYLNSMVAQDSLKAQGCNSCDAILVNPILDHQDCAQYALLFVKTYFDSLRINPCLPNSLKNIPNETNLLSISPNPSSDYISINFSSSRNYELKIIDFTGRAVYENNAYTNKELIHINHLANGVYSLQVKNKENIYDKKLFIIQH